MKIIYEQPLTERIRVFLRLESLFQKLHYYLQGESIWDNHAYLQTLFDLLTLFNRADLKTEILKEIEQQNKYLKQMQQNPNVDHDRVQSLIDQLDRYYHYFQQLHGPIAQELRDNEFLKGIMQRQAIPVGDCSFDLPNYHYWKQQPLSERQHMLSQWGKHFEIPDQTVKQLLEILRLCSLPTKEQSEQGQFQKTMEQDYSLLRIILPEEYEVYPEVSADKHRINLKFRPFDYQHSATVTEQVIDFQIIYCGNF